MPVRHKVKKVPKEVRQHFEDIYQGTEYSFEYQWWGEKENKKYGCLISENGKPISDAMYVSEGERIKAEDNRLQKESERKQRKIQPKEILLRRNYDTGHIDVLLIPSTARHRRNIEADLKMAYAEKTNYADFKNITEQYEKVHRVEFLEKQITRLEKEIKNLQTSKDGYAPMGQGYLTRKLILECENYKIHLSLLQEVLK